MAEARLGQEKDNIGDVFQKKVSLLVIQYALPSIVAMLSTALYIIVDGIFIGRYVGEAAMAAVNMVMPGWSLISGFGLMIGIGGGTLISIQLGKKNFEAARQRFSMIASTLTIFTLSTALLVFIFSQPIARFLGASPDIMDMVITYMRWSAFFMFALLGNYFFDYMLRASNRPNLAMIILSGASVINIGLDYLIIKVLGFGVGGAAVASGIAQLLAFFTMLYFLKRTPVGYRYRLVRMPWSLLSRALYNGSSELFTEISWGIATLLFNLTLMERIGVLGVSAYAIVSYLNTILAFMVIGLSISIQPLISIHLGARRYQRMGQILKTAYLYGLTFVGLAVLVVYSHSDWLVGWFVDNNPQLAQMASHALRIVVFNFVFMAFNVVSSAYFTAIEWAGTSIIISALRGMIFTFVGVSFLPLWLGLDGIWWTLPFSEGLTFLFALVLMAYHKKKLALSV